MTRHTQSFRRIAAVAMISSGLFCSAYASAAGAADGDTLSFSYGIYVQGARVYRIKYRAELGPDRYEIKISMQPKGVGKIFADFSLEMATSGIVEDGMPQPMNFTMRSAKDDESKTVALRWSSDALPKAERSFAIPVERATALNRVLKPAMPDPLTAVLQHALTAQSKPCQGTLRAYNGAEVQELKLRYLGRDEIEATGDGVYSGPAFKCEVVFVPVAGYSEKKLKKLLSKPPTYTVWFANIASPTTATRFVLPVRAVGKAGKRRFEILASDAEMSGRPLAALSKLEN
jgi:hypothetical protein